mmetsp:Transcript_127753/g.367738  ORF Transcript_127753/g.367738 Transcript_127753/m.367738 type:complete len:89 (-) Transcript_127753:61-327(-)
MFFASMYTAWTVMYQLFKIDGGEPLYAAVDWRTPNGSLKLVVGVLFGAFPGVAALYWCLGQARDCRDGILSDGEKRGLILIDRPLVAP